MRSTAKPHFIGYLPKRTVLRPDGLNAPAVEEICSASGCISELPDGWIDRWLHNELWVYDTRELAWSVVPEAERAQFHLYAFNLFAEIYHEGQWSPVEIPPLAVEPMPPTFERLGFDIVTRSGQCSFECSPLSCNHLAETIPVNRHCLIDDLASARQLQTQLDSRRCEPGPYCLVEVFRERQTAVSPR